MHDAGSWRDHPEIMKGGLSPAQKRIPFPVSLKLPFHVELERVRATERINLNRMIDDQFGRDQGIDLAGISSHLGHGVAHHG